MISIIIILILIITTIAIAIAIATTVSSILDSGALRDICDLLLFYIF